MYVPYFGVMNDTMYSVLRSNKYDNVMNNESGAHFIVCVPIRDWLEKMQVT